ncbi:MAG: ComEC/Rec2 family competence protein, partial [Lachnospiraceae bacterium]|nr:ComEC/Rec2 family competence protein [Lachnospiraceae bacterium]
MSRRPLFLISICTLLIFYVLNLLKIPLLPESREEEALASRISSGAFVTVSGTVREASDRGDYSVFILNNADCTADEKTCKIRGVRITESSGTRLRVGSRVSLSGILKPVQGATNDGQFDSASYYRVQDIGYTMKDPEILSVSSSCDYLREWLARLRSRANARILRAFPSDVSGILCAMLTGDRTHLEPDTRDLWQTGGITHMLAISGLHLSILGMALYRLLKKLRLPEQPAGILSLLVLLSYTILTGMSVSSLRAFLMFSLFLLSKAVG